MLCLVHGANTEAMIRVRAAVADDLPQMMEIAKRSVTAAQWTPEQYQKMLSSGRVVLVIEDDARVMGFIAGRGAAEEWEIENVAVAAPARRRGLGSHLLGEFLHHVRNRQGKEVFLEVRESNHAARKLYEKWAFIEAGRRKSYYQNPPEDALILKFYFPQMG
ncbi:MAG: ribosomal-protein-alanine N-acetyltransferase [Candidatus Angelobacter sp. Gp1-AA117]|nr:MAG: ribosomal-protein-alanine N-acetyltransferase [Candidatus Angelobacter sp. Gp1-AA117]